MTLPSGPPCATPRRTGVPPSGSASRSCRAVVRTPGLLATQVNDRQPESSVTTYSVGANFGCSTRARDPSLADPVVASLAGCGTCSSIRPRLRTEGPSSGQPWEHLAAVELDHLLVVGAHVGHVEL